MYPQGEIRGCGHRGVVIYRGYPSCILKVRLGGCSFIGISFRMTS
jgi:hypothetical protein